MTSIAYAYSLYCLNLAKGIIWQALLMSIVLISFQGGQTTLLARPSTPSMMGTGSVAPTMVLKAPPEGWTVAEMIPIAGQCSDATANPIKININGSLYYARAEGGYFDRSFPAAKGHNQVTVFCENRGGVGHASRTLHAAISPKKLKVVLSSDTDGVYTDLHIYEPDLQHVYWASTRSPSGGLFFLNAQNGSIDQPGYGPYLYVHPNPDQGVYKVVANYWPGGALQHTLARLDVILDEGLPGETRRSIDYPLARPGENQTMAYIVIRERSQPSVVFVPLEDDPGITPPELKAYWEALAAEDAKKKLNH